ncbi:MAG TPA: Crp/Fnr family transcriptional regulator [Gammaproteobacteria bacterium]|nr:Crp/Fnr family transcriptional regulator [Gammaproteobacteria bacterium]
MSNPIALHPEHSQLIRKLESIAVLGEEDRQGIFSLPMRPKSVAAHQDLVRHGDRPTDCCLLVDGFVCRYMRTEQGRRQIMSFHIPGDILDLHTLALSVMDHNLGTLVPSKVAFIPHESIREVTSRYLNLATALWRDTLIDAAIFREWLIGMGTRSAKTRIAHLLCELLVRFRAVGLTKDDAYELPITERDFGDALGLASNQVSDILTELRRDGLIKCEGTTVMVVAWEALKKVGEFDPTYLHVVT